MEVKAEGCRITAVTVYPDRAKISCSVDVNVRTGAHQIIIDDLPLVLDSDSVRVGGVGSAQVRLLSVDVRRHHYEESPAEKVPVRAGN